MPTHKSSDYKLTAVQYYLVEDKTQEEVCKIFKCSPRSLMRWVERYKKDGNVDIHYRKPVAYKVKFALFAIFRASMRRSFIFFIYSERSCSIL
jgi:transposase-like protein